MSRYTTAYTGLVSGLEEVVALQRLARQYEREDPIARSKQINALCRGAIVLLCSHLEGYVKTLGENILDALWVKSVDRARLPSRLFYYISKDILDEIRDTSDPDRIASKVFLLLARDGSYWNETTPFPNAVDAERFQKGFATPSLAKINSYLYRFGYQEFFRDIGRVLRADYQPTVNSLEHTVATRNKIAHGDKDTKKTPGEVLEMIDFVRRFCRETDKVVGDWCTGNLCPIR